MTGLQWMLLGTLFALYLLFGGTIFMVIEQKHEIELNADFAILRKDVREILLKLDHEYYKNGTPDAVIQNILLAKQGVINRISENCGGQDLLEGTDEFKWTFTNSVFFAFTAVTTIGYGHLFPTTDLSRIITIIYALIGIPINGIIISGLCNYYSSKFRKVRKLLKDETGRNKHESGKAFVIDVLFLLPGLLAFHIVPSVFFVIIENWSFVEAIYFSVVTLATIGFGDYVPGIGHSQSLWLPLYKIAVMIWIIFGLGYMVMILSFITKGLTHDKVRVVLSKKLNQVKSVKQKLEDMDYIRKVVNELYLMKVNPIYNDDEDDNCSLVSWNSCYYIRPRTISLPNIYRISSNININNNSFTKIRKQGVSYPDLRELRRRRSETDLDRIDRKKTFREAIKQAILPGELLAAVTNAIQDLSQSQIKINTVDNNDIGEETEYESSNISDRSHWEELIDILPPWELGTTTNTSDKEILLDQDNGELVQVVIHQQKSRKNSINIFQTPRLIQRRFSEMIRKLSTGTKDSNTNKSNESPSPRKISQDSDRMRKISNSSDTETSNKISFEPEGPSNGRPLGRNEQLKPAKSLSDLTFKKRNKPINLSRISKVFQIPRSRKMSRLFLHRSSEPSPRLFQTPFKRKRRRISKGEDLELDNNYTQYNQNYHRRRLKTVTGTETTIVQEENFTDCTQKRSVKSAPESASNSRKISREDQFNLQHNKLYGGDLDDHPSLRDLLRALDTVHDKLKRNQAASNDHGLLHRNSCKDNFCCTTCNTSTILVPFETSETNIGGCGGRNLPSMYANTFTTFTADIKSENNANKAEAKARLIQRRRKLGLCHPPEFSFANTAFQNNDGGGCDNKKLTQDNNNSSLCLSVNVSLCLLTYLLICLFACSLSPPRRRSFK